MSRFLLAAATCALAASGLALADERATAIGKVTDASGQPINHAAVLVYKARVKKGYSIYCPTCWVDCGKRGFTDGDGQFSVAGLNPDLVFTLMVVKEGYSAAFIDDVDPAKGPAQTTSLKPRTPIENPAQVVRGRVVDAHGDPVNDAVVEQQGIIFGDGRSFGPRDWIDLSAVTNENGEFEMAFSKPATAMILNVTGRGMAPKLVTEPTGPDRRTITITQGATIRGRLLQPDGKPVANAEIGVSSHSRFSGTTFPEVRIGTKEDGTFAITNVPAGRIWLVYPKMESIAGRGLAGKAEPCETKDDGQNVDVGTIQLGSAYTLRGRVVLSNGSTIPPDMRVLLGSDHGDSQMSVLAPDGSFEFKGLSKAVYTLMPGVRGYKVPDGDTNEVLVDRDRSDVVLHLERITPRK